MYDYREAMKDDIQDYIKSEGLKITEANREEIEESLNEDLWTADSVTGNASGSYTFNRYIAEDYVKDNLDLCIEALREFGYSAEVFGVKVADEEWEYLDVTIRCYLLSECLSEVLDELQEIEENLQNCGEAEKVVKAKLYETFRDLHDEEWAEEFDTATTEEMISKLYNSCCDDVFWMDAGITLSEIRAYLWETTDDEDEVYSKLGSLTDSYILCEAFDLMK